jgi:hypothetical protein
MIIIDDKLTATNEKVGLCLLGGVGVGGKGVLVGMINERMVRENKKVRGD